MNSPYVRYDDLWVTPNDAMSLRLDGLVFGVTFVKLTGEMCGGEQVYRRINPTDVYPWEPQAGPGQCGKPVVQAESHHTRSEDEPEA